MKLDRENRRLSKSLLRASIEVAFFPSLTQASVLAYAASVSARRVNLPSNPCMECPHETGCPYGSHPAMVPLSSSYCCLFASFKSFTKPYAA